MALAAFAFAPGLALGSFLNVVAARVPLRRSIVSPGSACMELRPRARVVRQHPARLVALAARPLPLVRRRDPVRYPAVELVTALLVAGCVWKFGLDGRRGRRLVLLRSRSSPSRPPISSTGSSRTGSCCPPPRSCSSRTRRSTRAREWAIGAVGAVRLPLRRRARLPEGDGHGRREARAPDGRGARAARCRWR